MLHTKPRVKVITEFEPPKFGVIFDDDPVELHDTFDDALKQANTIAQVNGTLAELFTGHHADVDACP
jgi:hypothetical protein